MGKSENLTIGLVGTGGDGVIVLGSLFQYLAALQGYSGQMQKYYGAQIRGGGSAVKLNINTSSPVWPKDELDILVCFSWNKYTEFKDELSVNENTIVICENDPAGEIIPLKNSFKIPFAEISAKLASEKRNKNILTLGLLMEMILGAETEKIKAAAETDKNLALLKINFPIFENGKNLFFEFLLPKIEPGSFQNDFPKIVISGNEAAAEAAIRAGCRAFFGYPITPATEIMKEMGKKLPSVSGVFRQAEDEIAAANNGIGASLAGTKSLIATSGPGISLMTETMDLAVGMEVSLVIIDVQRGGPSTGIPSKSEQSDLYHAIFSGHGDAPRIVLAPHDVESVYRLTIEGFNLAEYYQTLVIILSDQLLGQTSFAIKKDFLNEPYFITDRKKPLSSPEKAYSRYEKTCNGISPMSNIGDENGIYQTAGLSHAADGSHNPDFETLEKWHEKISEKLTPLNSLNSLVKIFGDNDSEFRIITWGSSTQAVLAAVKNSKLENNVAICVPELIYPLPKRAKEFVNTAENLLVVEMNYSAQFYHYLRSQTHMKSTAMVYKRSGGKPFGIRELEKAIKKFIWIVC